MSSRRVLVLALVGAAACCCVDLDDAATETSHPALVARTPTPPSTSAPERLPSGHAEPLLASAAIGELGLPAAADPAPRTPRAAPDPSGRISSLAAAPPVEDEIAPPASLHDTMVARAKARRERARLEAARAEMARAEAEASADSVAEPERETPAVSGPVSGKPAVHAAAVMPAVVAPAVAPAVVAPAVVTPASTPAPATPAVATQLGEAQVAPNVTASSASNAAADHPALAAVPSPAPVLAAPAPANAPVLAPPAAQAYPQAAYPYAYGAPPALPPQGYAGGYPPAHVVYANPYAVPGTYAPFAPIPPGAYGAPVMYPGGYAAGYPTGYAPVAYPPQMAWVAAPAVSPAPAEASRSFESEPSPTTSERDLAKLVDSAEALEHKLERLDTRLARMPARTARPVLATESPISTRDFVHGSVVKRPAPAPARDVDRAVHLIQRLTTRIERLEDRFEGPYNDEPTGLAPSVPATRQAAEPTASNGQGKR